MKTVVDTISFMEYPKIETVFDRDPTNMKKVIVGSFRLPEFALVNRWLVTEKVDGTNVRLIIKPTGVSIGGRTESAQMPTSLIDAIWEKHPPEILQEAFDPGATAVIFGEGYGPKIQSGGWYTDEPAFIVFDVAVITPERVWWLNWSDVCDVAMKINAPTVSVLRDDATMEQALGLVDSGSYLALHGTGTERQQEGIVCRTDPLLFTRSGDRVIWKLKGRDL